MAMRKTTAKAKTATQVNENSEGVTLEQALKEEGEGRTPENIKSEVKKTDGSTKVEQTIKVNEKPDGVALEQAPKEEGEGRTPEKLNKAPTKMEKATKIMEEMWNDIQTGKVKRKDVIKRFMEEVPLSKAGSSTYYGSIKAKLTKSV